MNRSLLAKFCLSALLLVLAGANLVSASELPDFLTDAGCPVAQASDAVVPAGNPAPQFLTGMCSPLCGVESCRGAAVGMPCVGFTGRPGTCHGPELGKKCSDGLPMCTCN